MRLKSCLLMAILITCFGTSVAAGDIDTDGWTIPDCDAIKGTISVTYTSDDGATVFDPKPGEAEVATPGLVTLDADNTLMTAIYDGYGIEIFRSEDAGCTWTEIELPHMRTFLYLTPAPGGVVYAWYDTQQILFRIEGDRATLLESPDYIYGMAADPNDAMHIRFGGTDCQLYESFDGGATFSPIGKPATVYLNTLAVDFSPHDWDCVYCGTKGAWRSTDAGNSWERIDPFDWADGDIVYSFAFSPDDPQRVWARATLNTNSIRSREILVSSDGGRSFTGVVDEDDSAIDQYGRVRDVILTNWLPLAPLPGLPDVLYFPYGSFNNERGSDLYRYDARLDELTVKHVSDNFEDISSIVFHPADPSLMYLGVQSVHPKATNPGIEETAEVELVSTYPNPFNPVANISFRLANASHVRLEIFNIMGQRVGTLVDDYLDAGEHARTWDGSKAASGVYLYRLQVGQTVHTEKMVLLK